MSHVDDGQLNALLDGELPSADARAVESHVAACADCRRRLEEARAFLRDANALLDSLNPLAAPASGASATAERRAEEPARPSRQSLPVRPVGALADLPGGEPGAIRPAAPPPPRPPVESRPAAVQPPRKVMKTAREVAVDIDGRTAMAAGISPVFTDDAAGTPAQRGRPPRRGLDLEKLAWAANIVLALGVGFLANEVRWMHSERAPAAARVDTVTIGQNQPRDVAARTSATPGQAAGALQRQEPRGVSGPAQTAGARRNPGLTHSGTTRSGTTRNAVARSSARPGGATSHTNLAQSKPPIARSNKGAPTVTRSAPLGLAARQAPAADQIAAAERQPPPNAPTAAQNRADLDAGRAAPGAGASGGAPAPAAARPFAAPAAARPRSAALEEPAVRTTPGFTRITMEEAVRTLSSSIRQVDGMTPLSIEAGGGRLVAGSDASREVVRVNYTDQYGRRFTLDQQLAEPRAGRAFNGIIPGDTLVAPTTDGGARVRWLDGKFWLSLSGPVPGNEIRALVGRVR